MPIRHAPMAQLLGEPRLGLGPVREAGQRVVRREGCGLIEACAKLEGAEIHWGDETGCAATTCVGAATRRKGTRLGYA